MLFKKTISILTAVLVVICCLPLTSSAYGDEVVLSERVTPELRFSYPNGGETEAALSEWVNTEEFRELLIENIGKTNVLIDISSLNLPHSAWKNVVDFIFYNLPEAFNVYDLGCSHDGTQLLFLHLGYRDFADTPEEYADCFGRMKAGADLLLSGIENNSALSDEYKALLLHDRLCVYNEYPFYTDITDIEHTAYGALANRSSVCQGYAMAYMYLLNRAGIKNYYCSSNKLNHAWNIVYIDGKPYHVDVTFDDINWEKQGLRNVSGALHHKNFLVSTNTLRNRDHNAYDFDSTPADTKYDNYYWGNSDTEFQLVGNKIFYIDNKTEFLMCVGSENELADVSSVWTAGGSSYWLGNYSRLSSHGGELFFSLPDSIYKYTVETGECRKIYSPYLHNGFSVFGFTYEDGKLVCDINTAPPYGDVSFLSRTEFAYNDITHIMNGIGVDTKNSVTQYYIGDSFRDGSIVVKAYFSDGTEEIVTNQAEFSGFDSSSPGINTVKVEYGDFSAEFNVQIKMPAVILNTGSVSVREGEEISLTAATEPAGQTISWSGSSENVQIKDGIITAVKSGMADITAEFTYNGRVYSAVCRVNVLCPHKNTSVHKEIPPTLESAGYTEGVFCNDCKKYISGHEEIPKIDLSFSSSDFAVTDGKNVRIIVGKLVTELLWFAPYGSFVEDKNGNPLGDRSFVGTGMILVLPDNSRQAIVVPGDADGDAMLSAADARFALRVAVGLEIYSETSPHYIAANVDAADGLSAGDARAILRAAVGLEEINLL